MPSLQKHFGEIYSLYCFLTTTHNCQFLQNWASYRGYGNSWLASEVQPQFRRTRRSCSGNLGCGCWGLLPHWSLNGHLPTQSFLRARGISPYSQVSAGAGRPSHPLTLCLRSLPPHWFLLLLWGEGEVCPLSQTPSSPSLPSLPRNHFL